MKNLRDSNPSKIQRNNRGLSLQSSLYGRGKDLCEVITEGQLASVDGLDYVLKAVHNQNPLSVVTLVFKELRLLLLIKYGENEKQKYLESRFGPQLSKFNALGISIHLSVSISSLILLSNADVDVSQRISILAEAAPSDPSFNSTSATDYYSKLGKYVTMPLFSASVTNKPASKLISLYHLHQEIFTLISTTKISHLLATLP